MTLVFYLLSHLHCHRAPDAAFTVSGIVASSFLVVGADDATRTSSTDVPVASASAEWSLCGEENANFPSVVVIVKRNAALKPDAIICIRIARVLVRLLRLHCIGGPRGRVVGNTIKETKKENVSAREKGCGDLF